MHTRRKTPLCCSHNVIVDKTVLWQWAPRQCMQGSFLTRAPVLLHRSCARIEILVTTPARGLNFVHPNSAFEGLPASLLPGIIFNHRETVVISGSPLEDIWPRQCQCYALNKLSCRFITKPASYERAVQNIDLVWATFAVKRIFQLVINNIPYWL